MRPRSKVTPDRYALSRRAGDIHFTPKKPRIDSVQILYSVAPSTSLWVTRIVRGQPWATESLTQ